MRRKALALLLVLSALTASSSVLAVGPDPLEATADCDKWAFGGTMHFGTWDYAGYDFTVELFRGDEVVYTYSETGTLYLADGMEFMFNGEWDMDLCGEYRMFVTFLWDGEYGVGGKHAEYLFSCDCAPACPHPPVFWMNHQDMWPADELTVGCEDYSKDDLVRIMRCKPRGDITVSLFRQLVAAKLNVLNGADDSIEEWVSAGDDFLCKHPLRSKPKCKVRKKAVIIWTHLVVYNWLPCDSAVSGALFSIEGSASAENAEAAVEETSWGSIKKMHR
jgi:hypothetical protein